MPKDKLNLRGSNVHAYGAESAALNLRHRTHKPSGSGLSVKGSTVVGRGSGRFPPSQPAKSSDHPFARSAHPKAKQKPKSRIRKV